MLHENSQMTVKPAVAKTGADVDATRYSSCSRLWRVSKNTETESVTFTFRISELLSYRISIVVAAHVAAWKALCLPAFFLLLFFERHPWRSPSRTRANFATSSKVNQV